MNSGVYIIYNTASDKYYIGSSINIPKRLMEHKNALKRGNHKNKHLQNSWNLYGEDYFMMGLVEKVDNINDLLNREQFWINILRACEYGYNFCPTAGNSFGTKLTEETKDKIRNKAIGRVITDKNTLLKMKERSSGSRNAMFGKTHLISSKEKMKILKSGESKSEAYKGENNHFYGKNHSDESKEKISIANKGRKSRRVLNDSQVLDIKNKIKNKENNLTWNELYAILSIENDVSVGCIRKIKTGERWKDE